MTEISIQTLDDGIFLVTLREGSSETQHRVSGAKDSHQLEAAFRFLLDREPKESILRSFDFAVISRYFPEFEAELPKYLKGK